VKPKPSAAPMRIWYQSFTDHDETRRYHDRLSAHLASVARPGTQIEVVGMSPPARRHRITELRCALDAVKNAIRAEREGYDAFILGHFQDSGLWDARSAIDLPVVGLGENAMLHACTLGRKIGLVTIHPIHIPFHEDQILRYGLQQRIVAVSAVESAANDYVRAFGDPKVAKGIAAKYAKEIRALIARGIEVVIPAGGLPSLLFGAALRVSAAPAVVLDSVALAVKSAELAVDLRRFNGTAPSRASTFALPWPAALEALGVAVAAPKRKSK
jgi:allantoin racemase